jgi:hypothetical protein
VSETTLSLDRIQVQVTGLFTTHHFLETEAGCLAEITFPAFGQGGTARTQGGRELLMHKTGWFSGAHELVENGSVRGAADRVSAFGREMEIEVDGHRFQLVPEGILRRGWFLVDAQGRRVLEFQPRAFGKDVEITIWHTVDADLAVFAYYLYYVRTQEESAAAVAATS